MTDLGNSTSTLVNRPAFRWLAWLGVALQAVGFVAVLWFQRWNGAWIIGAFFVLSVTFLLMQDRVPSLLNLLVVLAALVNALGWSLNFFNRFVWYDEVVHFFSSFAVVSAIGYLGWTQDLIGGSSRSFIFICKVTAIGLALGIAWEVIEMVFLNLQFRDTVVDLVLDVLGAAAGAWFASWVIERRERPDLRTNRLQTW